VSSTTAGEKNETQSSKDFESKRKAVQAVRGRQKGRGNGGEGISIKVLLNYFVSEKNM